MGLTVSHLQGRLARFEFEALFQEDLGWLPATEAMAHGESGASFVIAQRGQTSVILVLDWPLEALAPPALYQRLNALEFGGSDPLVVAIAADGNRSLWCWRQGSAATPHWRTRVVIRGQGDWSWANRLRRLQSDVWDWAIGLGAVLTSGAITITPERYQGFRQSWQALAEALAPWPVGQRRHYGLILLTRLIAVAALQQLGYLGQDEWFLHNQFGQSQQRGRDRFFIDWFQPLCSQGFSLPPEERPLALQHRWETLPFLPTGPFSPHDLDRQWGSRSMADGAFEPALEWLGDLLMEPATVLADLLPELLETAVNGHDGDALVTPEPVLWALGDRTLNATVLDRATAVTGQPYPGIEALLMALTPAQAQALLAELEGLTLLDPACGSGRYLLAALHHLLYLIKGLAAIASLEEGARVPDWVQSPPPGLSGSRGLNLYRHLVTHSLYGLDLWPPAVEMARLQIFLAGLPHAKTAAELASLPDLSLTIFQGNALMGLITVDAERFDQIAPRRRRAFNPAPGDAAPRQGNLLQPLMADTYQATLAERQVRLEHYRSQTELLAETGNVPTYAQADFLRDRIEELNQTTQAKLTQLLWSQASQQLGLRVQTQTDTGQRQSRPLMLADVEAQAPFHWGFVVHGLLRNQGGFDIVLSHFPAGRVQPTESGFLEAYADLFEAKSVATSTFLHNHKQVLTIDPDLTLAWANYRGSVAWPGQYFRHSGHYPYNGQSAPGASQGRLYWSRLFLERSLQLLRPGGRCGVALDPFWAAANSAPLRHWLEAHTRVGGVVDMTNHGGLWPELPPRTTLGLLWLTRSGHTQDCPYSAYGGAAKAPRSDTLAALLQRLIDLAE